jgi:hypothetical protein
MHKSKHSNLVWPVILFMALTLALTACTSTPLPPLFIAGGAGSGQPSLQPAAPAAAVASAGAAAVGETPAVAATDALTVSAVSAGVAVTLPLEMPTAAVVVTGAIDLVATSPVTDTSLVEAAAGVTGTALITSTTEITAARASVVAAAPAAPTATPIAPTPTRPAPTPTRVAPTATRVAPTATRVAPTATRSAPTATRAPARPAATPTPEWPKTLVITADDIEQGATSVPGLQVTGLDVQFGSNTMTMSFDSLRYSFVSLRDVTIEGHFEVNNGDVTFVADRISPRNLATSAIPGFINQSLDQQLGQWYVESLSIQPGQLAATVRPRS